MNEDVNTFVSASSNILSFQTSRTLSRNTSTEERNLFQGRSARNLATDVVETLYSVNPTLLEKNYDEVHDGSYLFVRTDNPKRLVSILNERGCYVKDIGKSKTPGVLLVLFQTHKMAKRAFTTQRDIGLQMVPHSCTIKNWWRNPAPNFHVMFENKRRLTVKNGRSIDKMKVGDFLMIDARRERGCTIWADQMKGKRLRIVGFVGRFRNMNGCIIERHAPPSDEEKTVIGWISTVCNKTKIKLVVRLTGNKIEDYVFNRSKSYLE